MATPFDFGFLDKFSSIFVVLFVIIVFYMVLQARKFLGENPSLHFTLAVSVGLLFIFMKPAVESLKFMLPWFMIMIVSFLMLTMVTSVFVGGDVFGYLKAAGTVNTWYNWGFIIGIIIILLAVSNSVGQNVGPFLEGENQSITGAAEEWRGTGDVGSGDFKQNLGATIFHPKILSLILVFFILAMSAYFITRVAV